MRVAAIEGRPPSRIQAKPEGIETMMENRMTELEKIGAELAKLVLAIPTWETGSAKEFYEIRKSLWDGVQTKAREFLRVSEEAHRK